MRLPSTLQLEVNLEDAMRYSMFDMHVPGMLSLCLKRTPEETIKVYMFSDAIVDLPEVVIPHNHRYDFLSTVLRGAVRNITWTQHEKNVLHSEPYECFDYLTPLNGGDGFHWRHGTWLRQDQDLIYEAGETYAMQSSGIHTIQIMEPRTILMITQYEDKLAIGTPTWAFKPEGQRGTPDLEGLYTPMQEADVRFWLHHLENLTGLNLKVSSL